MKHYYVYMLASAKNGTLYVGVTSDLVGRIWQHREGHFGGFTRKYGVARLVWFSVHEEVHAAIGEEKKLKRWRRDWKKDLIERDNPHWEDFYPSLVPGEMSAPERKRVQAG